MKTNLKKAVERIETFRGAWAKNGATSTLGGMTLEEFTEATKVPCEAKAEAAELRKEAKRKHVKGLNALPDVVALVDRMTYAVQASPEFGPDSAFYQELGYIRKSDRKKGLTRKDGTQSKVSNTSPGAAANQPVGDSPSTDAQ